MITHLSFSTDDRARFYLCARGSSDLGDCLVAGGGERSTGVYVVTGRLYCW